MKSSLANILIVDDNEIDRMAIQRILEGLGHSIRVADDGATAMKLINEFPPDLVFLDINMPDMDGMEMLTLVRRAWTDEEMPIIMITGSDNRKSLGEALKSGANDYIVKPITPVSLQTRLKLHLTIMELRARLSKISQP